MEPWMDQKPTDMFTRAFAKEKGKVMECDAEFKPQGPEV
jgi:hypothetical protein